MMKKISRIILLFLFLNTIFLPILPVLAQPKPVPAAPPRFTVGSIGTMRNWGPTTYAVSPGDWYIADCIEPLFNYQYGWDGNFTTLTPELAINWTIEDRDPEMNNYIGGPFMNYGGIKAMNFTLRDNVTFHDGSAWNATVCKWNIDRMMVIFGNMTGNTPPDPNLKNAANNWYLDAKKWAPFETTNWNVSKYLGNLPTYGIYTSQSESYRDWYPRINEPIILEDKPSGGKIRIEFNDWGIGAPYYMFLYPAVYMISMEAYKNYFDVPIYGYGQIPAFPQPDVSEGYPSTGFPGHMIGTGPYRFIEHDDVVLQGGTLRRYEDYWNATELQAAGWHLVDEVGISTFPESQAGIDTRNLAMTTGAISYAYDTTWEPLVYADMIASPSINYNDMGPEAYGPSITMNCINETYWKTYDDLNLDPSLFGLWFPIEVDGINRTLRKAVSYVFDYDKYINQTRAGRAVRSGGLLGVRNEYYNASIPLAYRDLTIARETLLNDLYNYGPKCAARGLTILNSTDDWRTVAEGGNPIDVFELTWELDFIDIRNILEDSLKDIGIALDQDASWLMIPSQYDAYLGYYFPYFTTDASIWSWTMVDVGALGWLEAYYKSPGIFPDGSQAAINWPYEQFFNAAFNYNYTLDQLIQRMWFMNASSTQKAYNEFCDYTQNFQYTHVYIAQHLWGQASNKDWEVLFGIKDSGFSYAYIKFVGTEFPPIPGFPLGVIGFASIMAMLGVIYVVMRKRKFA